jgi:putative NADH-flavin reductase
MKVLVVGAAGKTGRAVVEQAMKQGHQVTAFVHSDGGYDVPGVVEIKTGDASNTAAMENAILGQDAVVDTVGGKVPYKHTTLEGDVAAAIVGAMQRQGVRRLVVTSMYGEGDSGANAAFYVKILMATFLRGEVPDKAQKESTVTGSGLDWVIVRPPFLTEKPATGEVRVFSPDSHDHPHTITRSDLAAFMVTQLTSDENLRKAVTIANR